MAKSEKIAKHKQKKKLEKRANSTLSKEVANSLCEIVKQGGKLFTKHQWDNNLPIVIIDGETRVEVKPQTYNNWMTRESIVPGVGKSFKQMMIDAKELRAQLRHEQERRELIRKAQEGLKALQALPIGTKTTLTRKKYRVVKDGEKYQTGEETEVQERDIDPQLVSIKHRGNEFVLERLDPEYAVKKESKNTTVMLSLADLRKAKEEKESKHADYEQ